MRENRRVQVGGRKVDKETRGGVGRESDFPHRNWGKEP